MPINLPAFTSYLHKLPISIYHAEYYTFWEMGEPSNATGENCLELHHLFGRWNDANCDVKKPFICQREYGILIG